MTSIVARLLSVLLLSASPAAWALLLDGHNFSDDEIFSAVVQRFKKSLTHRFNSADTSDSKPLLVLGSKLRFGQKITSQNFVHLTQQELIEQQQAVFVMIEKAYPDTASMALYVDYNMPSNASFGTLKLYGQNGKLVVEPYETWRSSSGARATYGELYKGVVCKDNSEMAYRQNYYADRRNSGRCLEVIFTEF